MKDGKPFTTLGNPLSSRKVKALLVGFALMCGLLLAVTSVPATATNGNLILYAPETSTPPTIDGVLSPGEWNGSTHYKTYFVPTSPHPPDDIDVFLLSQPDALYIAYDVQPDNSTDTDDCAYLAFDLNNNGTRDFLLSVSRDFVQYNDVQWKWTNCSNLTWDIAFGFNTTPQETGRNHTIIEIKLGINKTDSSVDQNPSTLTHLPFGNSPVGVMFGGYGTLAPGWIYGNSSEVIQFSFLDATMYADLYLGSPSLPPTTFTAPYTSTPPTIDGVLSPGEWSGATQLQIYFEPSSYHPPDYINVFLLSQNDALYIAYDVLPDDTIEPGDSAYLAFDLNDNGTQDILMYVSRNGANNELHLNGTNCSNLIWSNAFGFSTSPHEPVRNHTIFEMKFAINKTDSNVDQDASTLTHLPFGNSPVGAMFGGYGTLTPTWVCGNTSSVQIFNILDASMYGNLTLGSPPEQPEDGFPWWILVLAIGLPAIAVVAVILILRKRKG